MRYPLLSLAFLLSAAVPVFAAPTGLDYTPPAPPTPPDAAGLVLRLVGLTAALVTLCGGVLWFARRATRQRAPKGDGGGRLKYDGALPLDRTCTLHLLRADGQTVAVTTDATGVRSIVVLSEPFEAALAAAGAEPAP